MTAVTRSAGKKRHTNESAAKSNRKLEVPKTRDEPEGTAIARQVIRPTVQSAATLAEFDRRMFGDLELAGLVEALSEQTEALIQGETGRAEAMLAAQAHTLDCLFNALAQRSLLNMGEYVDAADRYMRLALKAQSQCRTTWEALTAIKNPPMVGYVGQANIAHNQQINNGAKTPPGDASSGRKGHNRPNELLEQANGERLDPGAAEAAGCADPEMASVGSVNRAENVGRKSEGVAERIQGREAPARSGGRCATQRAAASMGEVA